MSVAGIGNKKGVTGVPTVTMRGCPRASTWSSRRSGQGLVVVSWPRFGGLRSASCVVRLSRQAAFLQTNALAVQDDDFDRNMNDRKIRIRACSFSFFCQQFSVSNVVTFASGFLPLRNG